jgi:hypothetical protein
LRKYIIATLHPLSQDPRASTGFGGGQDGWQLGSLPKFPILLLLVLPLAMDFRSILP